LKEVLFDRKKSLKKANKKKRELREKWKKIKQRGTSSSITTKDSKRSNAKASYNQKQKLTKKKKIKNIASTSNLKETTPFKEPEENLSLRQKLNFQGTIQDASSSSVSKNSKKTILRNKSGESKITKFLTSTPLVHRNIQPSLSNISTENISNIEISDKENSDEEIRKTVSPVKNKSIPTRRGTRLQK